MKVVQMSEFRKLNTGKLVDRSRGVFECTECGTQWSPNIRPGGRWPRGHRHCPHECEQGKANSRFLNALEEKKQSLNEEFERYVASGGTSDTNTAQELLLIEDNLLSEKDQQDALEAVLWGALLSND